MCSTRKWWLFAFLFLAPVLGSAQSARSISWGVMGGIGAASDRGGGVPHPYDRLSTVFGAFVDRPVNSTWSLHPELAYASKGTKYDELTPPMGDLSGTLQLRYLEVPLMVRAARGSSTTRVYGELGPSLAYKIGCTATATQNEGTVPATCQDFGKLKKFDAGAAVGAGVELPSGSRAVIFGARYTLGEAKVFDGTSSKNRDLEFTAGFTF